MNCIYNILVDGSDYLSISRKKYFPTEELDLVLSSINNKYSQKGFSVVTEHIIDNMELFCLLSPQEGKSVCVTVKKLRDTEMYDSNRNRIYVGDILYLNADNRFQVTDEIDGGIIVRNVQTSFKSVLSQADLIINNYIIERK